MKQEQKLKIQAANAAKSASFKDQIITIDENWRIIRFDERNWQVEYKGRPMGFHGSSINALKALPGKMLSESSRGSLYAVYRTAQAIVEKIEKAFPQFRR